MKRTSSCICCFLILLIAPWVAAQTLSRGSISFEKCRPEGTKEEVWCGHYEVFEDRASRSGRKIKLKIVVFPATGPNKAPDPLFYIPGGPGSSATEDAPYVAQDWAKIRERRDLVFVDQRGTGGWNPLNCDFFDPQNIDSYFGFYFPLEDIKKCRKILERTSDLKLYTTEIASDDLDEVRAALGYEQINVSGGSYGTRASLDFIKRHPKSVRAALLQGISPQYQTMPLDFPQHTERALKGVLNECLADEPCRKAFPNVLNDHKMVLSRLLKGPVETTIKHPETKADITVRLTRDLAAEAIRYMLYQGAASSRLPLILNSAAKGNFSPLADAALFYRRVIVATGSNGRYLSVTCAEDLPFANAAHARKNGENTLLGSYRYDQQKAACDLWPTASISNVYRQPTKAETPALILTGQWDPVTPPEYGDATAKNLPNSLHIVLPSGGHGFSGLDGIDCIRNLTDTFIENGSVKGLDASCVSKIRRKEFALKFPEPN
jgi:pimeloyl-ACP methyl ester carboxylesterase